MSAITLSVRVIFFFFYASPPSIPKIRSFSAPEARSNITRFCFEEGIIYSWRGSSFCHVLWHCQSIRAMDYVSNLHKSANCFELTTGMLQYVPSNDTKNWNVTKIFFLYRLFYYYIKDVASQIFEWPLLHQQGWYLLHNSYIKMYRRKNALFLKRKMAIATIFPPVWFLLSNLRIWSRKYSHGKLNIVTSVNTFRCN